jgi:hypothetical protein
MKRTFAVVGAVLAVGAFTGQAAAAPVPSDAQVVCLVTGSTANTIVTINPAGAAAAAGLAGVVQLGDSSSRPATPFTASCEAGGPGSGWSF